MKTAMEEFIEKHDRKIEEDPEYAINHLQSLIVDGSYDIEEIKNCIEKMRKNEDLPVYIKHRLDMISLSMTGAENNMEKVLQIVKKAEEDETKKQELLNREQNQGENKNDNNQTKRIRDEQLVNSCCCHSSEGGL